MAVVLTVSCSVSSLPPLTRTSVLQLTKSEFESFSVEDKQKAVDLLVSVSRQSIPVTPRLASLAFGEKQVAQQKIQELGIDPSSARHEAVSSPGGGYAIVGGRSY